MVIRPKLRQLSRRIEAGLNAGTAQYRKPVAADLLLGIFTDTPKLRPFQFSWSGLHEVNDELRIFGGQNLDGSTTSLANLVPLCTFELLKISLTQTRIRSFVVTSPGNKNTLLVVLVNLEFSLELS